MPVSLVGELQSVPNSGGGWGQINGQPVWLGSVASAGAVVAQVGAGGSVAVTGVRLGNGVIWANLVQSVKR